MIFRFEIILFAIRIMMVITTDLLFQTRRDSVQQKSLSLSLQKEFPSLLSDKLLLTSLQGSLAKHALQNVMEFLLLFLAY